MLGVVKGGERWGLLRVGVLGLFIVGSVGGC